MMRLSPSLAHFVGRQSGGRRRRLLFGHVQACAGRLGAAALSPLSGGNPSGPAKPVPRGSANRARGFAAQWAVLMSACLAPLAALAQAPSDLPTLPASASSIAEFVPSGWSIEQQHSADFGRNGRRGVLLLLRMGGDAGSAGGNGGMSPARILAPLVRTRAGYTRVGQNGRLIPRVDLASQEDPMANGEIAVRTGGFDLRLGLMSGVGSYLTASLKFRFRLEGGCFRLIGFDRLETHRATLATQDLSINFLRGTLVRTSGNAQSDASQQTRERLKSNPRRCLEDLPSAAEFQPL